MIVLAAVLADAFRIRLHIAGLLHGALERRREQRRQGRIATEQVGFERLHGLLGALRLRGAGDHAPGLRDGVDLAFVIRGRAQGRAVVEEPAAIPLAIPAMRFQRVAQLAGVAEPPRGEREFAARLRQRSKGIERGVQEPAQPHALAAAMFAHAIHAVVPVARADERQAVHAEIGAVQPAAAMLEQRGRLIADLRLEETVVPLARQRRTLDEG